MEYTVGSEKKSRAKEANESKLNELERPKSPSLDLTKQQFFDQEKTNLEQRLENKRKEWEKINQYSHALEDLESKKSKNENICEKLLNSRKKAEREQQGVKELNEEIKNTFLGLRNKNPNDQLKLLVDQSKKKVEDKDKGEYGQKVLDKLLQDHRIRLRKEVPFFNRNKILFEILDDERKDDIDSRPILQNNIISDTENLMQALGIKIKIDWDAYFDQETPIEIGSTDDCGKIISELPRARDQDKLRTKHYEQYNKALRQFNETHFVADYLHYVLLSRFYEQVKENLSLAIEPKPERERPQGIDFQDSRFDSNTCTRLMELIAKADQLVEYRKKRQAIELEVGKKIETLQKQEDPHAQIVSEFYKKVMDAVEALKDEKMFDDEINKNCRASVEKIINYCKNQGTTIKALPAYSEVQRLYKSCCNENQQCQEIAKGLQFIEEGLAESRNRANEGQSSVTSEHKEEFENKLVNLIKSRVYIYNTFRIPTASKIHASLLFFDAISKKLPDSLKSLFEKNKEVKAEIQTEITKIDKEYNKSIIQKKNIREQIKQLEQKFKDEFPSSKNSKDIQTWLTQRREELQKEVERNTRKLELMKSGLKSLQEEQAEKASSSQDPLEIAPESTLDENQKLLKDPIVKSLKKVYYEKYRTKIDMLKANASANYLNKLNLVGEIEKQAIEAAAHLIKYFDATFNDVSINRETREIVIVKPSESMVDSNVSKVEFDHFGRLRIDGKQQKAFVTASPEEMPDVLILPVKAEMAYGSVAFAGGTPMLPGGTAGIEDLLGIEKGNMNILAIAARREFKEETQEKYQLVEETIKYVTKINRTREDIIFFDAKARPTPTVLETKECTETKGTFLLNIIDMIRENKLSIYSNPFRREFTMKQAILQEAQRQRPDLIANVPAKEGDFRDGPEGEPQWGQYLTAYCTNHLVNYIVDRLPGFTKQRQEISYRLLGCDDSSWRTLSGLDDQRVRGSDSANWRAQDSEGLNRRVGRSDSSNWREQGSSSSSANS